MSSIGVASSTTSGELEVELRAGDAAVLEALTGLLDPNPGLAIAEHSKFELALDAAGDRAPGAVAGRRPPTKRTERPAATRQGRTTSTADGPRRARRRERRPGRRCGRGGRDGGRTASPIPVIADDADTQPTATVDGEPGA